MTCNFNSIGIVATAFSTVLAVAMPGSHPDRPQRPVPGERNRPNRSPGCTGPLVSSNMAFELEGLDLDSGTVYASESPIDMDPSVDVIFAYNADTTPHLRVFPQYPAAAGLLEKVSFSAANCDHTQDTDMSMDTNDTPVSAEDTVIVSTAEGRTYKLGNALESMDLTVEFDFTEMCLACPAR
jgi:hypothetical protein